MMSKVITAGLLALLIGTGCIKGKVNRVLYDLNEEDIVTGEVKDKVETKDTTLEAVNKPMSKEWQEAVLASFGLDLEQLTEFLRDGSTDTLRVEMKSQVDRCEIVDSQWSNKVTTVDIAMNEAPTIKNVGLLLRAESDDFGGDDFVKFLGSESKIPVIFDSQSDELILGSRVKRTHLVDVRCALIHDSDSSVSQSIIFRMTNLTTERHVTVRAFLIKQEGYQEKDFNLNDSATADYKVVGIMDVSEEVNHSIKRVLNGTVSTYLRGLVKPFAITNVSDQK